MPARLAAMTIAARCWVSEQKYSTGSALRPMLNIALSCFIRRIGSTPIRKRSPRSRRTLLANSRTPRSRLPASMPSCNSIVVTSWAGSQFLRWSFVQTTTSSLRDISPKNTPGSFRALDTSGSNEVVTRFRALSRTSSAGLPSNSSRGCKHEEDTYRDSTFLSFLALGTCRRLAIEEPEDCRTLPGRGKRGYASQGDCRRTLKESGPRCDRREQARGWRQYRGIRSRSIRTGWLHTVHGDNWHPRCERESL